MSTEPLRIIATVKKLPLRTNEKPKLLDDLAVLLEGLESGEWAQIHKGDTRSARKCSANLRMTMCYHYESTNHPYKITQRSGDVWVTKVEQ